MKIIGDGPIQGKVSCMKNNQANNPFASVGEMCKKLELTNSSKLNPWRLVNTELGQINGLPQSHGRIIAADGIRCVILLETGKTYIGHHAWWIPDQCTSQPNTTVPSERSTKKQTRLYAGF